MAVFEWIGVDTKLPCLPSAWWLGLASSVTGSVSTYIDESRFSERSLVLMAGYAPPPPMVERDSADIGWGRRGRTCTADCPEFRDAVVFGYLEDVRFADAEASRIGAASLADVQNSAGQEDRVPFELTPSYLIQAHPTSSEHMLCPTAARRYGSATS